MNSSCSDFSDALSEAEFSQKVSLLPEELDEISSALRSAEEYAQRVTSSICRRDSSSNSCIAASEIPLFCEYFEISEEPNESIKKFIDRYSTSFDSDTPLKCIQDAQRSISEVHLEVAVLEGLGRFSSSSTVRFGSPSQCAGAGAVPDVSSCVFHLSLASRMGCCAAILALGRLRLGVGTDVSQLLKYVVARDVGKAKGLLLLAALRGSKSALLHLGQIAEEENGIS